MLDRLGRRGAGGRAGAGDRRRARREAPGDRAARSRPRRRPAGRRLARPRRVHRAAAGLGERAVRPPRAMPCGGRARRAAVQLSFRTFPRPACGRLPMASGSSPGRLPAMSTDGARPKSPLVEARDIHEDLRHRQGQGARPERGRPRDRPRRDGGDHGAERLRQDDAPELPLRPRRRRRGRRADRRHVARVDVGSRAHRLPRPAHGLRLPVLQPDARPERGRERRAAAPDRAPVAEGGAGARARSARASSGSPSAPTTSPTSSPEASASASRSRGRS